MAFQQGLSGLESSSTQLDVIGNNIANSSTVGFKSSQAQFADIYANSLNSVAGNTAGIGVSTSNIAQSFTQGALTTSANPLDIAISGAGFFRTVANGQVQYTRNGQFQVDKSGFLTNAQGANITGYNAINGKIVAGPPVPIQIDAADMAPKATTLATITGNLTSTATMPTTVPFNAQDSTSYNNEQTTTVYDSLGNASTLNTYYVKTGEDTWDVYTGVNNQEVTSATVSAASQTDPASVADRAAYRSMPRISAQQPSSMRSMPVPPFSPRRLPPAPASPSKTPSPHRMRAPRPSPPRPVRRPTKSMRRSRPPSMSRPSRPHR